MKKKLIIITLSLSCLIATFSLIIPNILERRVPEMKQFLKDQGYNNAQVQDINGFKYQVTFKTNKGNVNVVTVKNGGFAIRY